MKLIAAPGLQVPMADNPHRYITDSEPVEVLEDTYYHRRIAEGDLKLVVEEGERQAVAEVAPPPANEKAVKAARKTQVD